MSEPTACHPACFSRTARKRNKVDRRQEIASFALALAFALALRFLLMPCFKVLVKLTLD